MYDSKTSIIDFILKVENVANEEKKNILQKKLSIMRNSKNINELNINELLSWNFLELEAILCFCKLNYSHVYPILEKYFQNLCSFKDKFEIVMNQLMKEKTMEHKAKTIETFEIENKHFYSIDKLNEINKHSVRNNLKESSNKVDLSHLESQSIFDENKKIPENQIINAAKTTSNLFDSSPKPLRNTKEFLKISPEMILKQINENRVSQQIMRNEKLRQSTFKVLNLKQLIEIINDIYLQKTKYDEKCMKNQMPKENLEKYLFTYLNQKYGLKPLISDWTKSILNGIQNFGNTEIEIEIFGKILKNEIEEDCQYIPSRMRDSITNFFVNYFRKRFKFKTNIQIQDYIEVIKKESIDKFIMNDLLNSLYQPNLVPLVKHTICENYSAHVKESHSSSKKGRPGAIPYQIIEKTLIEFTLRTHELYINPFLQLYRTIDVERKGIITNNAFIKLCNSLEVFQNEADIEELISILDPFVHNSITFSDILSLFTTREVISEGKQTILDEYIAKFKIKN